MTHFTLALAGMVTAFSFFTGTFNTTTSSKSEDVIGDYVSMVSKETDAFVNELSKLVGTYVDEALSQPIDKNFDDNMEKTAEKFVDELEKTCESFGEKQEKNGNDLGNKFDKETAKTVTNVVKSFLRKEKLFK